MRTAFASGLTVATITVAVLAAAVAAKPDNPCTRSWTGPSVNNSLECKVIDDGEPWQTAVNPYIGTIVGVAAPFVLGLLVCMSCPFVFCARYGCMCCGGWKQRPGTGCCACGDEWDLRAEEEREGAYSDTEVMCNKGTAALLAVVAVVAVVVAVMGQGQLVSGIDELKTGVLDLINWATGIATRVIDSIVGPDPNASLPSDFARTISEQRARIRDFNTSVTNSETRQTIDKHLKQAVEAAGVVGFPTILPAAVLVLGLVAAFVGVQTCCPACIVCLCFLLILPVGIIATVFQAVDVPFSLVCAELDAQTAKQPGFLQWGVVPQCNKTNPADKLDDELTKQQQRLAGDLCVDLRVLCDTATTYDPVGASGRYFTCSANVTGVPLNCTTVAEVERLLDDMRVKLGVPGTCNASSPGGVGNCSVENCATYCAPGSDLGNFSTEVMDGTAMINRFNATFRDLVLPWMDCNRLLDHIISHISPLCGTLHGGTKMVGMAFLITEACLFVGITVYFMGQKRFFRRKDSPVQGQWRPVDSQSQEMMTTNAAYGSSPHERDHGAW